MTVAEGFQQCFGQPPDEVADAPGRVNLIGEHTDYNDGYVLPIAIPLRTWVAVRRRDDDLVVAASRERDERREYRVGAESRAGDWLDYLQGVTAALRGANHPTRGYEAYVEGDVPLGSGLASSAALEVGLLRALRAAFELAIDDLTLARLGQHAENDFVGARVGIMDQLAASLADEHHALFVDTRSLTFERVPLPPAVELVVINSGVSHSNVAGDYNQRRAECERACALLGLTSLRDIDPADLATLAALPDPLDRRARHVVTENARVIETVAALRAGDLDAVGRHFAASHASMRDDYEVSVPEVDLLVDLATNQPGVVGARLTGGGFGGSIVALARTGTGRRVAEQVKAEYDRRAHARATILLPPAT
ncbi:MAG: galactokinase [Chloroflexi bacterium]|nr:galactokinase [Chloroflexota bacterium]